MRLAAPGPSPQKQATFRPCVRIGAGHDKGTGVRVGGSGHKAAHIEFPPMHKRKRHLRAPVLLKRCGGWRPIVARDRRPFLLCHRYARRPTCPKGNPEPDYPKRRGCSTRDVGPPAAETSRTMSTPTPDAASNGLTYREAGVDIEAGDALVEAIKPAAKATTRSGVMGGLGGFGALFDLKAAGFTDPVLVSCTDGVGTKLNLAIDSGLHETVGIDLVAMCVNDLVVQGAEPLFFLDYFATGKLAVEDAAKVVRGIAEGCRLSGCALVGGETAEMPGMYAAGHYDLAGFSVGAAERGKLLPGTIRPGDALIGLTASGVHSNGFSLVRRILEKSGLALNDAAPFAPGQTIAQALMTPTRLYVEQVLALHRDGLLSGAAHITGGGLPGNLPRVLPKGTKAVIDGPWVPNPVFGWLAKAGNVATDEMLRVFNCGIGMVLITPKPNLVMQRLSELGETPVVLGQIEAAATSDAAPTLEMVVSPDFAHA